MNRSLVTPRWVLLHLLFLAATIATGLLAWWQWERAHDAGGSAQNLGYALMWPLFGMFTVFLWHRIVTLEPRTETNAAVVSEPRSGQESGTPDSAGRKRPLVPEPAPPVSGDEDPELAAYNEYLAELNRAEQQR